MKTRFIPRRLWTFAGLLLILPGMMLRAQDDNSNPDIGGAPAFITLVSGDHQMAAAGGWFPQPLRMRVTDNLDQPIPGVMVSLNAGFGKLNSTPSVMAATYWYGVYTDSDGYAQIYFMTFDTAPAGAIATVDASIDSSASTVTFHCYVNGPLVPVSGDNQVDESGVWLPQPLKVQMRDASNNPMPAGLPVTFEVVAGGGSLSGVASGDSPAATLSATTDADGCAQAYLQLAGEALSTNTVQVRSGTSTTGIDMHGYVAGGIAIISGNQQVATTGFWLPKPLKIRVFNSAGSALADKAVAFSVTDGGGKLSSDGTGTGVTTLPAIMTDSAGYAHVFLQLDGSVGSVSTIRASAGTHPAAVVFQATVALDTDGDGIPDSVELAIDPDHDVDPNADADDDGFSNLYEYQHGTNPKVDNAGFTLTYQTVEAAGSKGLSNNAWSAFAGFAKVDGVTPYYFTMDLENHESNTGNPANTSGRDITYHGEAGSPRHDYATGSFGYLQYTPNVYSGSDRNWSHVVTHHHELQDPLPPHDYDTTVDSDTTIAITSDLGCGSSSGEAIVSASIKNFISLSSDVVVTGSVTLSMPYTTNAFIYNVAQCYPDYGSVWTKARRDDPTKSMSFPNDSGNIQGWLYLIQDESDAGMVKTHYKLHALPGYTGGNVTWSEVKIYNDGSTEVIPRIWDGTADVTYEMDGALLAKNGQPKSGHWYLLPPQTLAVDNQNDGVIDGKDLAPTVDKPFHFWLNDDDDLHSSFQRADYTTTNVDGLDDLKQDFFPVFLDIQKLIQLLPPSDGYIYKLKQADSAVNFVYTNLTQSMAYSYKTGAVDAVGYGPSFHQHALEAETKQVTATGLELDADFLNNIKNENKGVILVEGCKPSIQPLVLSVEKGGAVVTEVSLPLCIGARILLLLHGMNSDSSTWDGFVTHTFNGSSAVIREGSIPTSVPTPLLSSHGVRCYRLQFGAYDLAGTRVGVESLTATSAPGYATYPTRCGDFEPFYDLGQEVDDAIDFLLDPTKNPQNKNAQIVLLGHSRGGISARAFLQSSSTNRSAVVALLTTGTPHRGSPLGRIYDWLAAEVDPSTGVRQLDFSGQPVNPNDWKIVDWLRSPTTFWVVPKPPLDLRRPVIGMLADGSSDLATLNASSAVSILPANIRYGEIVYHEVLLGILSLGSVDGYSVFDGRTIPPVPALPETTAHIILAPYTTATAANKTTAEHKYRGDGLVPAASQYFTTLPGFAGTAIEPLLIIGPAIDRGTIVHTDEPSQYGDLLTQLKALVTDWLP